MVCCTSALTSTMSPFLASFLSSLIRGLAAIAVSWKSDCRCDAQRQPPQPPIVTFTGLLALKNEPSFILATAMMFCVFARRMRVLASADAARRREVERYHAGARIFVRDHQHLGDIGLLGHRAVDRHRHRHGVAVLGDLRQVELDAALAGVLPPVNFLITSSASFLASAGADRGASTATLIAPAPSARGLAAIEDDRHFNSPDLAICCFNCSQRTGDISVGTPCLSIGHAR